MSRGGQSRSPIYAVWKSMIHRCRNPKIRNYANYGGRGIGVCQRWASSFDAFRDDMGPRPTPNHTLDRIDNDGNYEPGNCRWATRSEQSANKRCTRLVEIDGVLAPIQVWERRLGLPENRLLRRLDAGWSVEDAVSIEPHKYPRSRYRKN